MPYIIKPVKGGYKVAKKANPSVVFSKKPLTSVQAKKQRTAIILSEHPEFLKSRISGNRKK